MHESQSRGRLRLRHLREVNEAKAEEMDAMRGRFERLKDSRSAPRVVQAFNLFQTPPALAELVTAMAGEGRDFGRVLEPSAGLGRIYRALRAVHVGPIELVEVAPQCCRELYEAIEGDGAATLHQADFLEWHVANRFDTIVMNPPFKMGRDIKHILHARDLLAPGGRLVAICAAGEKRRRAFADAAWVDLPAGSFRSEGTNVAAAIVTFDN